MADVDDIDELIATRKLHGLEDGLFEESDKNAANDKDYTLAYLKGFSDAEEKYRTRIKDLIESETIDISGFEYIAVEDLEELLEDKQVEKR